MRIAPPLTCLLCTLLFMSTGCSTTSPSRPASRERPGTARPAMDTAPLRTELLLLNFAEASGWVAFVDSDTAVEDTEDYRILIQRESTGEILFESNIPLARGLRTHGFEMSRDDARLVDIASTVNAGILPPLSQIQKAPRRLDEKLETFESPPAPAEESISVLEGIHVIEATDTTLVLALDDPENFKVGDRIFLRTSPETFQDPETGSTVILSRGRIAGLLEITRLDDDRATATLQSGEIPSEGYLERVSREL